MPQVLVKLVLRFLYEEESDLFRDGITYTAENKVEIAIDSRSNLFDERVLSAHLLLLVQSLLLISITRMVRRK